MPLSTFVIGIIKAMTLQAAGFYTVASFLPVVGDRWRRIMTAFISVLAVVGGLSFFNWSPSHLPTGSYVHQWDSFHYYMGAKYFDELGYLHLYEATFIAGQDSPRIASVGHLLDQTDYEIASTSAVSADAVRALFTDERWEEFRGDVMFFSNRIGDWKGLLLDHGYNAPPFRSVLQTPLMNMVDLGETSLWMLSRLDYILLTLVFVLLVYTFGPRVGLLAITFFFCNQLGKIDFVGGSILRFDWLVALLGGIACLKLGRDKTAGALFAYSVLSRVFPVLFVAFLGLKAVQARVQRKRDEPLERCLASFVVTGIAVGLLSLAVYGGTYSSYIDKMQLHGKHPGYNRVGLAMVDYYGGEKTGAQLGTGQFPFEQYKARAHARRTSMPFFVGLLALALSALASLKLTPFRAMRHGALLMFCFLAASHYYYSFLVVLVLLPFADGEAHLFDVLGTLALFAAMIYGFVLEHLTGLLVIQCHHVGVAVFLVLLLNLAADLARARYPQLERYRWQFAWESPQPAIAR